MEDTLKLLSYSGYSSFEVLGDKWTLLILRDMLFEGKSSFSEFKASKEKIASNILTNRLAKLDAEGFVIKTASTTNKVKYRYSLTDKAIDLLPIFVTLFEWEAKHGHDSYSNHIYMQLVGNSITINEYSIQLKQLRDFILDL